MHRAPQTLARIRSRERSHALVRRLLFVTMNLEGFSSTAKARRGALWRDTARWVGARMLVRVSDLRAIHLPPVQFGTFARLPETSKQAA